VSYGEPIALKSRRELDQMREVGQHTGEILLTLREKAQAGVTTGELNDLAGEELKRRGLNSPFLNYSPGGLPPYPAVLCASINDEIVHGIPGSRELKEGDILSLDFGVESQGFHGDSAVTIPVGPISDEARKLLDTTRDSLYEGVREMVPGNRLSDIGAAVQKRAEAEGFSVVRQFVGHGIGPMVNVGSEKVRILDDGWTAVTEDGELSAHFEHTIAITEAGPEVLTRIEGSH